MSQENVDKYLRLKERAETKRRNADRAQGALDQRMAQMKADFGFKTVKEARQALQKGEEELTALEKKFDREVQKLEETHGDVLGA